MFEKKWIHVLSLALSLPSTILVMAWFSKFLVDNEILTWGWSISLFVLVIANSIFLMVYYAFRVKNKL